MQYRQDIVTQMPIMRVELITISIVTIQSIWHNSAAENRKFPPQICESCGATPPTDVTTKMFSVLQSTSGPLTDGENSVQIDA